MIMTQAQIAKLWTIVGIFQLYYVLNTWIVTQGGQEIFGAKLLLSSRVPAAMLGILICAALSIIVSALGTIYARRATSPWANRVPVVGFDEIDGHSREGTAYQGVMLSLISALPLLSLIHFWDVLSKGKIVVNSSPPRRAGMWDWTALISLDDPARICTDLAEGATLACAKGATFFPLAEPLVLAILTICAWLAGVRYWLLVFIKLEQRSA